MSPWSGGKGYEFKKNTHVLLNALSLVVICPAGTDHRATPHGGRSGGAYPKRAAGDLNDANAVFEDATAIKTDPEIIALARQLIAPARRQPMIPRTSKIVTRYGSAPRSMPSSRVRGPRMRKPRNRIAAMSSIYDALKKSLAELPKGLSDHSSATGSCCSCSCRDRMAREASPKPLVLVAEARIYPMA
jgi:hypothetical protein